MTKEMMSNEFIINPKQVREIIEKYCPQGKQGMTKEEKAVVDGSPRDILKDLKGFLGDQVIKDFVKENERIRKLNESYIEFSEKPKWTKEEVYALSQN